MKIALNRKLISVISPLFYHTLWISLYSFDSVQVYLPPVQHQTVVAVTTLELRSKHPVLSPLQTVLAAQHHISDALNAVAISNHHVIIPQNGLLL